MLHSIVTAAMAKTPFSFLVAAFPFYMALISVTKAQEATQKRFVNEYKRYRKNLGCDVPLCYRNDDLKVPQTTVHPNKTIISVVVNTPQCCSNCRCDSDCEKMGNCCPDKIVNFSRSGQYPQGGMYGCYLTSVKKKPEFSQTHRKMIDKCALNYTNKDVIKQCESLNPNTLEQFARVTHTNTKEAYRNVFCAWCNYIPNDELLFWKTSVHCQEGVLLFKNRSSVIPQLLTSSDCNIVFEPPEGHIPPSCTQVVSKCNMTGKWTEYDSLVKNACAAYTAEYRSVSQTYKNIFCYVCNSAKYLLSYCPVSLFKEYRGDEAVSFSALLDFTVPTPDKKKRTICPGSAIFDRYKGECREIICPSMTEFNNGSCQWIAHAATGLCFKVYIRATFSKHLHAKEMVASTHRYFSDLFRQCKGNSIFTIGLECFRIDDGKEWHSNETCVTIKAVFGQDMDFIDVIIKLDGETLSVDYFNTSKSITVEIFNTETEVNDNNGKEELVKQDKSSAKLSPIGMCSKTLIVSKFLSCAMVRLDNTDFSTKENDTAVILKQSDTILYPRDFVRLNKTQIQLCLDDYLTIAKKHLDDNNTIGLSVAEQALGIISHICMGCSILCLLITVAVYLSLPSLRTQPGVNNLFLSGFLLLAHVCLLIGLLPSVSGTLCIIIGFSVHFLWLNSMFWMNACSFHMFRSFGNMQVSAQRKATWQYMAYSLILSFALVITNVIWSEVKSNGEIIGYGKYSGICYIVYPEMVAGTMTIPVFLVIFANVVMFVVVIFRVCRTPLVPRSTLKNRSYFFIYIKLSTITGIAWLSYIPVLITKNVVFEIVFTILVECQGIFIMIAFVCNRRVLNLLKETILKRKSMRYMSSKSNSSTKTLEMSLQSSSKDNQGGVE